MPLATLKTLIKIYDAAARGQGKLVIECQRTILNRYRLKRTPEDFRLAVGALTKRELRPRAIREFCPTS